VAGSHGREVAVIESRKPVLAEALNNREYGAVDVADPEVLVSSHQLGGARVVGLGQVFNVQLAPRAIASRKAANWSPPSSRASR
jgi:hypothetical protein